VVRCRSCDKLGASHVCLHCRATIKDVDADLPCDHYVKRAWVGRPVVKHHEIVTGRLVECH
jgi:hypothetical protein